MESWLFNLVCQQTLQIAIVFLFAICFARLFARNKPHLAHALWGLVLIKAAILPWFASPTSLFYWLPTTQPLTADTFGQPTLNVSLNESPMSGEPDRSEVAYSSHFHSVSPLRIVVPPTKVSGLEPTSQVFEEWLRVTLTCLLAIWIVGGGVRFMGIRYQLHRLQRRVFASALDEADPFVEFARKQLTACHETISWWPFSQRQVNLVVVDEPIGPAVIGIISPTIILPKSLLAQCDAQALRPILTHELIHIRRHDNLWGLLQVLVTSLWWFNPLIHFASRKLDQETERCCDEETVATLQCKPTLYSRCMLLVLQSRQSCDILALPGVRPMEFNAERMKRIMTLKKKPNRKVPVSVLVLALCGLVLFAPGGTYAQVETPQLPPSTTEPNQSNNSDIETLVVYRTTDALAKLNQDDPGVDAKDVLKDHVLNTMIFALSNREVFPPEKIEQLRTQATENVRYADDDRLIVKAKPEQHKAISGTMQRLTRFGVSQLMLSTHFVTIRKRVFEGLDLTWSVHMPPSVANPAQAQSIRDFTPPILLTEITVEQQQELFKTITADKGTNYNSAPRVTVFNGQQATIFTGHTRAFGRDFLKRPAAEVTMEDSILVSEGLDITFKPEVENDQVRLNLVLSMAKIDEVNQVKFRSNSDSGVVTASLEVPAVTSYQLDCTKATIGLNKYLVAATLDPNDKNQMLLVLTRCEKISPAAQ